MAETIHELVAPERAGRLDKWLSEALGLSRGRVAALVTEGRVTVGGESVKGARKLRGGEAVVVSVPPPPDSRLVQQDILIGVTDATETDISMMGALSQEGSSSQDMCTATFDFPIAADFSSAPYFSVSASELAIAISGFSISINDYFAHHANGSLA